MAARVDGDSLRRATASGPSPGSANPCERRAIQLLTQLWKDSLRFCLFLFPMSRFSFCLVSFVDDFGRVEKRIVARQTQPARQLKSHRLRPASRLLYIQGT